MLFDFIVKAFFSSFFSSFLSYSLISTFLTSLESSRIGSSFFMKDARTDDSSEGFSLLCFTVLISYLKVIEGFFLAIVMKFAYDSPK
jgi:hypothetical protein